MTARTLTIAGALAGAVLLFAMARRDLSRDGGNAAAPEAAEAPAADSHPSSCTKGQSLYVSPDGAADAPGTLEQPLDLRTALSGASPAKPCDTIWLRGGTYTGTYATAIGGREGAPITIRQYAGERAVLDAAPSHDPALAINSNHVWVWGIEILNSDPQRTSAESVAWPADLRRGAGVVPRGTGVKLVNLVIHDLARGIDVEPEAVAPEFYGNIIFNNGWDGPQTSNGSGIETRNDGARQIIADNVIFNQYSHGILALGSDTLAVNNLTLEGNIAFNNGLPGRTGFSRDVLVGGGAEPAAQVILRGNMTYGGAQTFIGYATGCVNAVIKDNYLVGSTPLLLEKCTAVVENNTLFGQYGFGTLPRSYPANHYESARPTQSIVRYRPNRYEPGRAHVVVYNWERRPAVSIDLGKAGLASGDPFEIVDVQNYGAPPLVTGSVPAGGMVSVPMSELKTAAPTGHPAPLPHTAPEFAVFLVRRPTPQTRPTGTTP